MNFKLAFNIVELGILTGVLSIIYLFIYEKIIFNKNNRHSKEDLLNLENYERQKILIKNQKEFITVLEKDIAELEEGCKTYKHHLELSEKNLIEVTEELEKLINK